MNQLHLFITPLGDECITHPWLPGRAYVAYMGQTMSWARAQKIHHDGQPEDPVQYALHKCENECCGNPQHIYWVTQAQNIADIGQKLSWPDALVIRDMPGKQTKIAELYGISQPTVSLVKQGLRYAREPSNLIERKKHQHVSTSQARVIRASKKPTGKLAKKYGVTTNTIRKIRKGERQKAKSTKAERDQVRLNF